MSNGCQSCEQDDETCRAMRAETATACCVDCAMDKPGVLHMTDLADARPKLADLLGADPGWCGGLSVDEFMAEQRRDRYDGDVS